MNIRRGDIWWVDLEPTYGSQQRGRRPCLILTIDALNARRRTVGVVPLSSSPAVVAPLVVGVPSAGANSVALPDQLRAVDRNKLAKRVGALAPDDLAAVERAVKQIFGLI